MMVSGWPRARKNAAPKGKDKAQSGQPRLTPPLRTLDATTPATTAQVPKAIAGVRLSPSRRIAKAAANNGFVAVKPLVRLGPIVLMLVIARLADRTGLNNPTAANIRVPVVNQYDASTYNGDANQ